MVQVKSEIGRLRKVLPPQVASKRSAVTDARAQACIRMRKHRAAPVNEVAGWESMNPAHFERAPRNEDHFHAAGDLAASFGEVNFGLSEREFRDEVARCMNCGVCNRCELCLIFCPDMAIHRRDDGEGFEIDLRYCKGCGLCVKAFECPALIQPEKKAKVHVDHTVCVNCGSCLFACKEGALKVTDNPGSGASSYPRR